ncbi:MAG: type I-E CRISPR-associated protein Cse2/CasB [Christensenellaceae bacterium]|nr:type I-E CRISPR-associated protein Cse2/CasB [Christensenellaceae bacterium]
MSIKEEIGEFVLKRIRELDEETPYARASLAKLRRVAGKNPSETPEVWGITLRGGLLSSDAIEAIHTALALYAVHRQSKQKSMHLEGQSLGKAARVLIWKDKDGNREEAITRRFNAIASAGDLIELSRHARGLVQLLRSEDIELDYVQFARELYSFGRYADSRPGIRLKWGKDFYSLKPDTEKNEEENQDE